MRSFKYVALLLSAAAQGAESTQSRQNLFSLAEDKYIIDPNTSAHDVLESARAEQSDLPKFKGSVFSMENDNFYRQEKYQNPEIQDIQKIMNDMVPDQEVKNVQCAYGVIPECPKGQHCKSGECWPDAEEELKPEAAPLDMDINIEDGDLSNHLKAKNDSKTFNKFATVQVSDNRRPIYGVLTEPLRGNMKNTNNEGDQISADTSDHSYIPKAHVQFLEQSGIIVIPIDFQE